MDDRYEKQLETVIHRRLRDLPEVPAPATLVPRVLYQIQLRAERRWWRRPWAYWPLRARWLVTFAVALMVGVFGWGEWLWQTDLRTELWRLTLGWANVDTANWHVPVTLANAAGTTMRAVAGQYWIYAATLLLLMYGTCIGIGTAFVRVIGQQRWALGGVKV